MQVLYIVSSFVHDIGTSRYELYADPIDLKERLCSYHVSVEVVCAYMVIGNIQQHLGIFKLCSDFSCSDSFCAYVYWFLMRQIFLDIPGDIIPGVDISISTKPVEETLDAYTKRMREKKIEDVDMRIKEIKSDIPAYQEDLYQYFFVSEKPLHYDASKCPAQRIY